MKVLLFHPVLLPPKNYGGVERVVLWLARGLVERGHEVWVAALEGSRLPEGVRLLAVPHAQRSADDLLKRLPSGLEVVHWMAPPERGVSQQLPCSDLLTVHGNGQKGETFPLNTVFLSADHARRHGASAFVYNGLDPDEYRFERQKDPFFLFLSKTSWSVKNVRGAIRMAAKAGVPLKVSGGSRPWSARAEVFLRRNMSWEGPVDGARKADLLARARALLFPVTWPEPFGLVMVEALLSGTPVIASNKGSVPELIPETVGAVLPDPGQTAGEARWVEFLAEKMRNYDPDACRQWAMSRFHYRAMAEAYETVYRKIAAGEKLHQKNPVAGDWRIE